MIRISRAMRREQPKKVFQPDLLGSRPPMPALYRGDHFNTRLLGVWPYCGMWLPSQCRACICLVCLHPRIGCRLSYAIYIQRLSVANALVRSWQSDNGSSVEEQEPDPNQGVTRN
jgi:hypothetical protein